MSNKVQFGIKNVHYAVDASTGSTQAWSTPVAVEGAVSLSLAQVGDTTKFYADNSVYYASSSNQGYEGSLELAFVPDAMLQDVFGYTLDSTKKILVENANNEVKHFALGFQIDGDDNDSLFWMYDCVAERPSIASSTKNESIEPSTTTINITATPLSDGKVFAKSCGQTTTSVLSSWWNAVVQ